MSADSHATQSPLAPEAVPTAHRHAHHGPTNEEIESVHASIVKTFKSGKTKSYEFRVNQLKGMKRFLLENEKEIIAAVNHDLHRPLFESVACEVLPGVMEIDYMLAHLSEWMAPEHTPLPALFAPGSSQIVREPFGVVLVLGAFNYPVSLTLGPLVGAIAAGNCAVIKPSEMSTAVEKLISTKLPQYVDKSCFQVVCGDIPVTTKLLALRWDKVFFTGSTRVGRIVMEAAAKHLTPVSLELGGKSPTIIDEDVGDLDVAVTRLVWGKCVNAGQTCIAPDYVFCHEKHYDRFLNAIKKKIESFYGKDVQQSKDFSRIVSHGHWKRLKGLLDDSKDHVFCGGETDEADKFIAPTVLTEVRTDSKVMSEEIFGPLMPVFKYKKLDEVIDYVNGGEKPLTLYVFTRNSRTVQRLLKDVSSGSLVQNDCLFQFANVHAPFGGVGHSGMGGYHGKFSFDCFSHKRSVLLRDDHKILDIPIRYPPYTDFGLSVLRAAAGAPDIPHIKPLRLLGWTVAAGIVAVAIASLVARGPPANWF